MWNEQIQVVEPFNNYVEAYRVESDVHYQIYYVVARTRAGEWNCSCPDWIFRRPEGGCKHVTYVNAWKIRNNYVTPADVSGTSMPVQIARFAALDV